MSPGFNRLRLPTDDGLLLDWQPSDDVPNLPMPPQQRPLSRVAYAAAHVVADQFAAHGIGRPAALDWEATLAFRRHLWSYGLGVAEAMDTAQRGMGLDWSTAQELIAKSGAEARACDGVLACGAGTDQLDEAPHTLDEIVTAYEEQCAFVEAAGARVILMGSRALAAVAGSFEDYAYVYQRVLTQLQEPAILHWLGPMFDDGLAGYWGSDDIATATQSCLELITSNVDRIDGIKVSLLDREHEIEMRRLLPVGVRLFTGDDYNYPELIRGDATGWSDAMLGIFDPIAPAASAALLALDDDDLDTFGRILGPTVPLAHALFESPTAFYKTGIVFLAWLGGHQRQFRLIGGIESARSIPHLARVFALAEHAGLLPDRELATARMRLVLRIAGVDT